jgi:hypothetical protein
MNPASLAQLVEQKTLNLLVVGSNPTGGTRFLENDGPLVIGLSIISSLVYFVWFNNRLTNN